MKVAYIRVSTVEQNEERQLEAMKDKGIEKCFVEKTSAKNMTDRPVFNEMMNFVREGDTLYIHDLSRLARSTKDLLDIIERLNNKGVFLISNKESIDTSTPTGKLLLTVLGAIYEFERTNMLDRQREGIAIAKKEGKYKGGHPKKYDKALFNWLLSQYESRVINKVQFAKELKVSRPTLDKLLKENRNTNL